MKLPFVSRRSYEELLQKYDELAFKPSAPVRKGKPYKHRNTKGVTYYLNMKEFVLRGEVRQIYYFSRDRRPDAVALPTDKTVHENPRNGFLILRPRRTGDEQA